MKIDVHPVTDARGDVIGHTVGSRPIQYAGPTARPKPDPEVSNREPAEHDIWSRLAKVPADHPKRAEWEQDAYRLTAALRQAWAAEVEMEAEGFQSDVQPDDIPDDDMYWYDDPYGLNQEDA